MMTSCTEQEKRHYPSIHNQASQSEFRAHGRRYLPHGYGDDLDFVPVYPHIEPRHKSYVCSAAIATAIIYLSTVASFILLNFEAYREWPWPLTLDLCRPVCPDWRSSIRYVAQPPGSQYPATENWPQQWKSLRTYPGGWLALLWINSFQSQVEKIIVAPIHASLQDESNTRISV